MPLNKISQEQQAVFDGTEGLEDGDMLSYNAVAGDWENKSQDELDIAPQTSPSFTGAPSAPTQAPGNNTTLIATTEFVTEAVESAGYIPSTEKAVANGVATLDGAGIVPSSQLPTYLADTLTVAEPLTGHGSMFEPAAQDDMTTPATVANQFTVKAGQYRVNGTLIDLPATVVTLPAAPATSTLLSRKDLVYLQEDGSIGVYEGTNDSPTMADAGFSAVSGEAGLWVNGGTYATPLVSVQRRNQGAYHPAFNEWGCNRVFQDGANSFKLWYDALAQKLLSTEEAFDFGTSSTNKVPSPSLWGGLAKGSGRPDSKFYDAIYLSDITDLRLQAKAPSATQLEPNYWQNKAVANELRHFVTEGIPVTKVVERGVVETLSTTSGTVVQFTVGDAANYSVGDFSIVINQDNIVLAKGYISSVTEAPGITLTTTLANALADNLTETVNRTTGDIYTILKVEYTEATGADNTWTDVIGDPANYPRQWTGVIDYQSSVGAVGVVTGQVVECVALTSGNGTIGNCYLHVGAGFTQDLQTVGYTITFNWLDLGPKAEFLANATGFEGFPLLYGENGEDLIPDGTTKEFKMSRKVSNRVGGLFSDTNGVDWTAWTAWDSNQEGSSNSSGSTTQPVGRVFLQPYQTPAHIFADDVNSEVFGGKLGDVFSASRSGVEYGAAMISNMVSKVPVLSTGSYSQEVLQGYSIDTLLNSLTTGSSRPPRHGTTRVEANDTSGLAAKSLPYLHTNSNQAQLNIVFKEMVYDTTWGDDNTFTVVDNTSTDIDDNGNTILVGTKSTKLPLVTGE